MVRLDEEPNAGKVWTANELTLLRRLADDRVHTREIADRLGRSEYSVHSKARLERISLQSGRTRGEQRPLNRPR